MPREYLEGIVSHVPNLPKARTGASDAVGHQEVLLLSCVSGRRSDHVVSPLQGLGALSRLFNTQFPSGARSEVWRSIPNEKWPALILGLAILSFTTQLLTALVMVFFGSFLLAGRRARFVLLRRPRSILLRIRCSRMSCRLTVVLGTRSDRRSFVIRARAVRT